MKRKNVLKKVVAIIVVLMLLCVPTVNFAHSGRTDANGGHRDNKNKSGLGSYHYHCGGYPAHLHDGGVCPYTSPAPATLSSSESTSKTTTSTTKSSTPSKVNVSSVEIDTGNIEILIGESKKLKATVSPSNATDKTITWTSSNKDVVMVDSEGEIIALGVGEATIKVKTSNGKEDSIKVTVNPIKVTEINISEKDVKLKVDETVSLSITVLPENATDKTVAWSSENEEIATVDNGVITALKAGETKIICESKDGIKAEVNVVVEEIETLEVSATIDEDIDKVENEIESEETSTTTTSDSDALLGAACLGLMIGIPVYMGKRK